MDVSPNIVILRDSPSVPGGVAWGGPVWSGGCLVLCLLEMSVVVLQHMFSGISPLGPRIRDQAYYQFTEDKPCRSMSINCGMTLSCQKRDKAKTGKDGQLESINPMSFSSKMTSLFHAEAGSGDSNSRSTLSQHLTVQESIVTRLER